MPLDLGNDTAWLVPGRSLVAEAGMIAAHLVRGTPDRTIEQIADPLLQHLVGRKADRVLDPLGLQELVDPWRGEGRISPDAFVMAVPDAQLLLAMSRADAGIHIEHDASRRTTSMNAINPLAGEVGEC